MPLRVILSSEVQNIPWIFHHDTFVLFTSFSAWSFFYRSGRFASSQLIKAGGTCYTWSLWAIEPGWREYGNHLLEQKMTSLYLSHWYPNKAQRCVKNREFLFIPGIQYMEGFSTYIEEFRTSKGRSLRQNQPLLGRKPFSPSSESLAEDFGEDYKWFTTHDHPI